MVAAIVVFNGSCNSLLNEALCKRVTLPLESALLMIAGYGMRDICIRDICIRDICIRDICIIDCVLVW